MENNNKKHPLGRVFLNNKVKKNMENNNKKHPLGKSGPRKPFLIVATVSKHSQR